eukprot:NODE_2650_length_2172_cov_10.578973.p1 GENE.NODE_2650_length_2172_cov_10.578973~~NODE_2650_length_2172_cov_10.578973.p1  ORF type:complete len:499 (-),score=112.19 NODE_2650_length_2172_cov_10.578973:509-2005(-)
MGVKTQTMAPEAPEEEEYDLESVQLDYEETCDEVAELQKELRAATLEAQQMRLRLQAVTGGKGVAPCCMPEVVVNTAPNPEEQRATELRTLFEWVAQHVDASEPDVFEVNFQVPIAGRSVHLQRVVQWALDTKGLRLSVPIEHRDEIEALLTTARAPGGAGGDVLLGASVSSLSPSSSPVVGSRRTLDVALLRHLASTWDVVVGEFMTPAHAHAEPAVLLAHRGSSQGILLATWPTREALEAFHAMRAALGSALKVGERVEVAFEGQWYAGVLTAIDALGKAVVACDTDAPGLLTIAPMDHVRRPFLAAQPVVTAPSPQPRAPPAPSQHQKAPQPETVALPMPSPPLQRPQPQGTNVRPQPQSAATLPVEPQLLQPQPQPPEQQHRPQPRPASPSPPQIQSQMPAQMQPQQQSQPWLQPHAMFRHPSVPLRSHELLLPREQPLPSRPADGVAATGAAHTGASASSAAMLPQWAHGHSSRFQPHQSMRSPQLRRTRSSF